MTTNLKDLNLRPSLLEDLNQLGYETVEDLSQFDTPTLLRIPGMGGNQWRKIARALGRPPFSEQASRTRRG